MVVAILDFGSQYTQLIARRVRELGVYSEVFPGTVDAATLLERRPVAIVLSGGPRSVTDEDAPLVDRSLLSSGIPILGVCYGQQLLAHLLGGHVSPSGAREYGLASVRLEPSPLFKRISKNTVNVWMSHGDSVSKLPEGFRTIASSEACPVAGIANDEKMIYGVQFHPEVVHSESGTDLLAAFLFDIAKVQQNWSSSSFVESAIADVARVVGSEKHAICGLSGGVDSSVAAAICAKAIPGRLTCIFVDTGFLRANEREDVERAFSERVELVVVDARELFWKELRGESDPEKKRKTIGRLFIEVFDREATRISTEKAALGNAHGVEFLVQGTLYPDVIESVSIHGPSAVIKSHHNVGGLPERMKLKLVEPLRSLFKDEVREAGRKLGLPSSLVDRHPFPGPGLAIRVLGDLTPERVAVLQKADAIYLEELRRANLYDKIWQAFAVLLPVRSVGVMGDARTYEETCAIRAVTSVDGMTADWFPMPHDVLARISNRIVGEVRGINRVVYDISSKPPATIEWE